MLRTSGHRGVAGSSPKAFPRRWEMRSCLQERYRTHSEGGRGGKKEQGFLEGKQPEYQ